MIAIHYQCLIESHEEVSRSHYLTHLKLLNFASVDVNGTNPGVVVTGLLAAIRAFGTHLDELVEGDGIVPVCVRFLYGSVGNAAELLVRDVHAHHHP